jgi:hypothetical protein
MEYKAAKFRHADRWCSPGYGEQEIVFLLVFSISVSSRHLRTIGDRFFLGQYFGSRGGRQLSRICRLGN